jgi:hypothetical protein
MPARAQARSAVAVITAVTGAITPALAGTPALADSAPASLGLVRVQHVCSAGVCGTGVCGTGVCGTGVGGTGVCGTGVGSTAASGSDRRGGRELGGDRGRVAVAGDLRELLQRWLPGQAG